MSLFATRCHHLMPKKLSTNKQERAAQLKETGERYTGYCIELWLWEKGYALNGLMGNSFTIKPQYSQNSHRIDFRVVIASANSIICLVIDSKNWARYSSKDAKYYMKTIHIPPFDSLTADYKLMFLNIRLIPNVKTLLNKHDIEPIEVSEHFTDKQYFENFLLMIASMRNSIKNLDKLISLPDVSRDTSKLDNADAIKYDIELGKPYKLIMKKWKIRRSYLDNLRNQMKRAGLKLPRRNTRAFTRLKQYNDFFTRRDD